MRSLFLFLSVISLNVKAQKSYVDVFYRHKFDCDKGGTTPAVNVCSREKADFADSLLKHLWKRKLKGLDTDIQGFSAANLKKKGQSVDSSTLKIFNEQHTHAV